MCKHVLWLSVLKILPLTSAHMCPNPYFRPVSPLRKFYRLKNNASSILKYFSCRFSVKRTRQPLSQMFMNL